MNDLISRKALLAEYDRVHVGPPGGARKLIEDAPRVDAVDLPHWATERSYKNGYEQGKKDAMKQCAVTREKLIELLKSVYGTSFNAPHLAEHEIEPLADHLIANGVTFATDNNVGDKWIPVSEPPKDRGCYLISVKHWLDGKPVTREAFWNGADWLSCYWKKGDRVELTPRVTHWMPLPEAPKGE